MDMVRFSIHHSLTHSLLSRVGKKEIMVGVLWTLLSYIPKVVAVVYIYEVLKRTTRISPKKPLLTNLIDALLKIPFMLRLGAWGRPNAINEGCNILIIYHITTILYLTPSFCISLSPSLPFPSLPFPSIP